MSKRPYATPTLRHIAAADVPIVLEDYQPMRFRSVPIELTRRSSDGVGVLRFHEHDDRMDELLAPDLKLIAHPLTVSQMRVKLSKLRSDNNIVDDAYYYFPLHPSRFAEWRRVERRQRAHHQRLVRLESRLNYPGGRKYRSTLRALARDPLLIDEIAALEERREREGHASDGEVEHEASRWGARIVDDPLDPDFVQPSGEEARVLLERIKSRRMPTLPDRVDLSAEPGFRAPDQGTVNSSTGHAMAGAVAARMRRHVFPGDVLENPSREKLRARAAATGGVFVPGRDHLQPYEDSIQYPVRDVLEEDPKYPEYLDAIDAWHARGGRGHDGAPIPLHEWLGMTRDEYARWLERGPRKQGLGETKR